MCSFLADTWCLGVKNAMGPKRMRRREFEALGRRCYAPWRSHGLPIPLELARHVVFGAVGFACGLGFQAHRDFQRTRFALSRWEGPSAITFGMDGKPHYIDGPYEDPRRILATLERTVGRGGFHYTWRSARPTISAMAITTRLFSPIATPSSRRPMRRYPSQDEAQPPRP
jgi:hypothetical protein